MAESVSLVFELGFDERDAQETVDRGCYIGPVAAIVDGLRYGVTFYDYVRLSQELGDEIRRGRPFFAEPGLIVLHEVTRENMELAVRRLAEDGFFDSLRPIGETKPSAG